MIHIEKNNIPKELIDSNIFLYGGGYTGAVIVKLFREKGIEIIAIIDDDENLQGKDIEGIPIISLQKFSVIHQEKNNISMVLTSIYGKAILKKLEIFPNLQIYELFDWYSEITGNKDWINLICKEQELSILKFEWDLLKENWADEKSIQVLDGLWEYFKSKDLNDIEKICTDEEQYFIPEILNAIKSPLYIIDGGAYRGELLQSLLDNKLNFEKWYCFEPDPENHILLIEQAKQNNLSNQQICIKKGLWSERRKIYFESGNATRSCIVSYKTSDYVDVVSIDEYINMGKCNFIKMDIEGAELQALKGAMNVIKRERPILAICIYHSIRDYWEIPKLLMNELENYQYYVRHHALICNETVLYAIPI